MDLAAVKAKLKHLKDKKLVEKRFNSPYYCWQCEIEFEKWRCPRCNGNMFDQQKEDDYANECSGEEYY